jgi:NAD(P)-dependent dehydrogenase (short-subunit alcohol dehydrogenase family)
MSKVWFITGTSKGFGRIWAEAALKRGDKVAATARDISTLEPLKEKYGDNVLALALDVNDRSADFAAIKKAYDKFGRLDVVINNAGYGQFGMVEELSEQEARDQIETNLFGALWVTQAALPIMRKQGSGHIIQVSSIGGLVAFPGIGMYHASKWGLEGITQALSQEVANFGIKLTIVEPVGYSTDWGGPSAKISKPMQEYDPIRDYRKNHPIAKIKPGVPEATAPVILKLVDMEEPPLRILFGSWPNKMVHEEYQKRLDEWDKYDDLSKQAHG